MRVEIHLWHADLKEQHPQPTVCWGNHRQSAPIIAYCCANFLKQNFNMISMNINPSKLPLFMDIYMNRYYKCFRYQLSWVVVHLVSLSNKLATCYLRLLRSVSRPVLDEYGYKWPPIAMAGASSVDQQNRKKLSLSELLWKRINENSYVVKLFCINCFRYPLKIFIKSNNGSKLNFEVALNAQ